MMPLTVCPCVRIRFKSMNPTLDFVQAVRAFKNKACPLCPTGFGCHVLDTGDRVLKLRATGASDFRRGWRAGFDFCGLV